MVKENFLKYDSDKIWYARFRPLQKRCMPNPNIFEKWNDKSWLQSTRYPLWSSSGLLSKWSETGFLQNLKTASMSNEGGMFAS